MLPMRKILLNVVVLAAATLGGAVLATETAVLELQRIEERGLRALTPSRIESLLQAPAPAAHSGPEFSLSWLDAQPKARGGADLKCLSEALYFEARGETVKGQFAVAEVIRNRVKSSRFPSSICGVVNQGTGRKYACQFTYTCDGIAEHVGDQRAYDRVAKVARAVLDGKVPPMTNGATHYHTTAVNPNWARVYTRTTRIGVHIFYRHTYRSASN